MTTPTIGIVGGGIGGLLLARVLQVHGIASTVYERDEASHARTQGGPLDMHVESGQRALREAGLYEEFCRRTHPQGEAMRVLDKHGTVFIDQASEDSQESRPEIDRAALRDLLIASLAPGRIAWNHKLAAVRSLEGGRHELQFADGSSTTVDVLVGADGTWSKVRPLLSAAVPQYCGISYIELHLSDVEERHPDAAALVGGGLMFALSDNKGLIAHGGKHIHLGASLRVPQDWTESSGVDWSNVPAAREALLGAFGDWSAELTDLIRNCDDTIIPRLIYALPTEHAWERTPGVTLLGDAAHVMSPYAGEGANLALLDAAELALAVVEQSDDIEAALAQYEAAMFPRAAAAAQQSAQGLDRCFAADAPKGLVDFFTGVGVLADSVQ